MLDAIKFVAVLGLISIFTRGVQSGVPSGSVSNTSYEAQTASVYSGSGVVQEERRSYIVDASHLKAETVNNSSRCEGVLSRSFASESERSDAYNNCLAN